EPLVADGAVAAGHGPRLRSRRRSSGPAAGEDVVDGAEVGGLRRPDRLAPVFERALLAGGVAEFGTVDELGGALCGDVLTAARLGLVGDGIDGGRHGSRVHSLVSIDV